MSNSSLICYTKISPNTNPRNHVIDTITIHCMAGNTTIEACGAMFAKPSRGASSNYGIGSDGRIAMYAEESKRSWCTSSPSNDHRAVTIEVANDGGAETGWHVSDKAYASLINLCVDICQRNGIKELKWRGDKSLIGQVDKQNMTVHRWFANKACPGDYLYNLHPRIAAEVNARLTGAAPPQSSSGVLYRVQVGSFSNKANADAMLSKLKAAGFDGLVVTYTKPSSVTQVPDVIQVGSIVKVKQGAKTYTGGGVAAFIYNGKYRVDELRGDRAVLDKSGICTPFNTNDLELA